jgi:transposase
MKEAFAAILDRHQPNVVHTKLEEWTSWASHSGLKPFAKAARTIGKYMEGIVAYVVKMDGRSRVSGTAVDTCS